jgi:hypothetical protein
MGVIVCAITQLKQTKVQMPSSHFIILTLKIDGSMLHTWSNTEPPSAASMLSFRQYKLGLFLVAVYRCCNPHLTVIEI